MRERKSQKSIDNSNLLNHHDYDLTNWKVGSSVIEAPIPANAVPSGNVGSIPETLLVEHPQTLDILGYTKENGNTTVKHNATD